MHLSAIRILTEPADESKSTYRAKDNFVLEIPMKHLTIAFVIGLSGLVFSDSAFSQSGQGYSFPDGEKRFKNFLTDVAGPGAWVGAGVGTTFQHIGNTPPEWRKTTRGFARRFASNVGENFMEQASLYAVSEAFRQDPTYRKCDCKGATRRAAHALKSGFTASNRSGAMVFSPGKVAAPFVSNVVAVKLWYPERYRVQDGLRRGAYGFGFNVGFNLVREFFFKKK